MFDAYYVRARAIASDGGRAAARPGLRARREATRDERIRKAGRR